MSLRLAFENLGDDICKALLGFHAFSGCDQTGEFYDSSKLTYWKKLMTSPGDVLDAFKHLGVTLNEKTKNGETGTLCDELVLQKTNGQS